ncbi:Abi family protein [Lachnobacterium bovis]|uniref:Abi family protein n=1 Tax=Lachnobacterium bovis TaxID=140626 RepID=UPI0018C91A79|nr:Abi family protein [Lachnobacterium bovis]
MKEIYLYYKYKIRSGSVRRPGHFLKNTEKNTIAKYYSDKYAKQYVSTSPIRISVGDMQSALKIFNLVRNKCAHEERLYNSDFRNVRVASIATHFGRTN